ncbi:MAG TPA: dimethyl sulfoxide reductase anchor subunit family protein [Candidatus Hypogeohydataceae bacterium YC38]|nr:dimethyl sulfoxide reductase anchor subunit [Candidatus Brocadiales bacterium]
MEVQLLIFTIFTQLCVGVFIIAWITDFLVRKLHHQIVHVFDRMSTIVMIPALVLGTSAAIFHLGHPMYGFMAVTHFATSWLSREVVLFNVFLFLLTIYTFLWWFRMEDAELRRLIGILTALTGIAAVFSSGMLYTLPSHPSWHYWTTVVSFFLSSFFMGGAVLIFVYRFAHKALTPLWTDETRHPVLLFNQRNMACIFLAISTSYLIVITFHLLYLSKAGEEAAKSLSLMLDTYGIIFFVRVGIGLICPFALSIAALFLVRQEAVTRSEIVLTVAAICIIVGEVCSRILFFVTAVPLYVG